MDDLTARLEPVGHDWYRIPQTEGIIELVSRHTPDDVCLRRGDYLRVVDGQVVATAWPDDTTEIRLAGDVDDEPVRQAVPRAWAAYSEAARRAS